MPFKLKEVEAYCSYSSIYELNKSVKSSIIVLLFTIIIIRMYYHYFFPVLDHFLSVLSLYTVQTTGSRILILPAQIKKLGWNFY